MRAAAMCRPRGEGAGSGSAGADGGAASFVAHWRACMIEHGQTLTEEG